MLKQHGGDGEYHRNMETDMNTQTAKKKLAFAFLLNSPFKSPLHISKRLAAEAQNIAQNSN